MALFKFRKGGDEPVAAAPQTESIEALRRRARHRLIGAAVLVLIGVVGFPLVFDTQPRPIPVDIPIEIPDRNKARPLAVPSPAPSPSPAAAAAAGPVTTASKPVAEAAPAKVEAPVAKVEAPKAEPPRPEPRAEPAKPPPRAEVAKAEPAKPAAAPAGRDDGTRAQALLEGKPVLVSPQAEGRFIVQVGAFADDTKARETRQKVERAGLKTYTHVAETKDGKRTRVRVGPFGTRAEAEKAAEKIKGLDLPAAILTL
jgi:DedD protein